MKTSVKIIADSISETGKRITTFELEYPRIIHSEFLTHRQFSRNSASSRAIPTTKLHKHVEENPYIPTEWLYNKAGMQGGKSLPKLESGFLKSIWKHGLDSSLKTAKHLAEYELHKQYVNRVLEPYSYIKTVVTATEWDNWFNLRNHTDAQPEIHELAKLMQKVMEGSTPEVLRTHEYHTPYVSHSRDSFGAIIYGKGLSVVEAKKVSTSCCAQVSYRNLDTSLEKALNIFKKLFTSTPIHGSPFEHVASPMEITSLKENFLSIETWEIGTTHMDKDMDLWSANFKGWLQYRQTLKIQ